MDSRDDLMNFLMSASSSMPAASPHGLPQPNPGAKAAAKPQPKSSSVATPKKVVKRELEYEFTGKEQGDKWQQFRRKDTASSLASTPACKKKPQDPLLQSPGSLGDYEETKSTDEFMQEADEVSSMLANAMAIGKSNTTKPKESEKPQENEKPHEDEKPHEHEQTPAEPQGDRAVDDKSEEKPKCNDAKLRLYL